MIQVMKLNNQEILINSDLIETIEATPDTVITMSNGRKYITQESPEVLYKKIVDFRRMIGQGQQTYKQ